MKTFPMFTKKQNSDLFEINKITDEITFTSIRIDDEVIAIGLVVSSTKTAFVMSYDPADEMEYEDARMKAQNKIPFN